jgi:carbon storage regulator
MLILSRRPDESLRIGGEVIVTVLGFHGNQIRLGITAPASIVVDREEVHKRKRAERSAARRSAAEHLESQDARTDINQ